MNSSSPEISEGGKTVAENQALVDFLAAASELENDLANLPQEIDGNYYGALQKTVASRLTEF